MLAAVYQGPGKLSIEQVAEPRREPGGLVVRVTACAICGTDSRVLEHGQANVRVPQVLGHEITGVVAEAGPDSGGHQVGDRVALRPGIVCGACPECRAGRQNLCRQPVGSFGYALAGGFAEYVSVPASGLARGSVVPLPNEASRQDADSATADLVELSIFEPLACVLNGQELAGVTLGDSVVIIGAGPIGCMHALVARLRGASQVIIADVLGARLSLAARCAPDELVDSSRVDLAAVIQRATAGLGASVVIVACSSGAAQEQALGLARAGGRVVYFAGLPHANSVIRFDSNTLHYRQLALFGVKGSAHRHQNESLRLLASRRIDGRELITHRLPLADIAEGFRLVRSGAALKVAIVPGAASD